MRELQPSDRDRVKNMKKLSLFFIISISLISIFFLGCVNKESIKEKIENNPDEYLFPFDGFKYDSINVSVEGDRVYVVAKSSELDGEDVYLFVISNNSLILKSYCLEALPINLKERAIEIALSNEKIAYNADGVVTVRRILPQTSERFYMPKELFSVTWHGNKTVSALIDMDEEKIVNIYIR